MSFSKGKEMENNYQREIIEVNEEEEKMYVAVSKEVKQNNALLTWALQNSGGKPVCVIHVHQPANKIPTPIGYMPASSLEVKEVEAFRDKERVEMLNVLDEYLHISKKCGVTVEKLYIEADSVEIGILQLVEQHDIKKLVIGAAADKHYSKKMREVRSKKAIYVRDNAPLFCHIWFICKGYLIHTRKATSTPRSSVGERSLVVVGASAPPYYEASDASPPRWSSDSIDGSVSMPGSARALVRSSVSSPVHYPSIHPSEYSFQGKTSGLENLYIEECMRRREVETELANVKEELEWLKRHVAETPKKNEELETTELKKVKAELEYLKNNVLAELRMAIEQKALLQNQIGNSTFLLEMLGEKLASAINVVHKHDEI